MTRRGMIGSGLLMTAVALLMRTVGVLFSAYTARQLGESGSGLLALVMSVYTLAVTFAVSGITLAATRLTAGALGRGKPTRPVMRCCVTYALCTGVGAGILLFSLSGVIGTYWLDDPDTVLSLRILAVSLPFIAYSSALSGYFSAIRRVEKNAICSVLEQGMKIALTVAGFSFLLPLGTKYACAAVVGGSCIAEALSCLTAFFLYRHDRKRQDPCGCPLPSFCRGEGNDDPTLPKRLLSITVPTALTAYLRSGLLTLEHLLIPKGLCQFGDTRETALARYGVISGMAFPILLYPAALPGAFAGLLIPEFAEAEERGQKRRIERMTELGLRLTLAFAIGCALLLFLFGEEIGGLFYPGTDAGRVVRLLAPLIPVMYLDTTVDAMLRGLGEQIAVMKINILDALASVLLVWLLVPGLGIRGYEITVCVSEILNLCLSLHRLLKRVSFCPDVRRAVLSPLLSAVGGYCLTRIVYTRFFLPLLPYEWLAVVFALLWGGTLYTLLLLGTGGVQRKETSRVFFRRRRKKLTGGEE